MNDVAIHTLKVADGWEASVTVSGVTITRATGTTENDAVDDALSEFIREVKYRAPRYRRDEART